MLQLSNIRKENETTDQKHRYQHTKPSSSYCATSPVRSHPESLKHSLVFSGSSRYPSMTCGPSNANSPGVLGGKLHPFSYRILPSVFTPAVPRFTAVGKANGMSGCLAVNVMHRGTKGLTALAQIFQRNGSFGQIVRVVIVANNYNVFNSFRTSCLLPLVWSRAYGDA